MYKKNIYLTILILMLVFSVNGQKTIKLDVLKSGYQLASGVFGTTISCEKQLNKHSSFQLGLTFSRISYENVLLDHPVFGPTQEWTRSFWGLGLIPEYKYYFKKNEILKGLYASLYGKIIGSKVIKNDILLDKTSIENGVNIGIGLGLGYEFKIKRISINPYLGIGKGWSSHKDIFLVAGILDGFFTPDWLIHRIEFCIGYDL